MTLTDLKAFWLCGFILLTGCSLIGCSNADRPNTQLRKTNNSNVIDYLGSTPAGLYVKQDQLKMTVLLLVPTDEKAPSPFVGKEKIALAMTEDSTNPDINHVKIEINPKTHCVFDLESLNSTPQSFNLSLSKSNLEMIFIGKEANQILLLLKATPLLPAENEKTKAVGTSTLIQIEKSDHKFKFQSYKNGKVSWIKKNKDFKLEEEMSVFTGAPPEKIPIIDYDFDL